MRELIFLRAGAAAGGPGAIWWICRAMGMPSFRVPISAEWPAFINPYLADGRTLAACVCLVDMNVPRIRASMLAQYLDSIQRPRIRGAPRRTSFG